MCRFQAVCHSGDSSRRRCSSGCSLLVPVDCVLGYHSLTYTILTVQEDEQPGFVLV
jgi:hypothetical protein